MSRREDIKMISIGAEIFILFFFVLSSMEGAMAQNKYVIQKGEITFASIAELEVIKAYSTELKGKIDPATNQFAFRVSIRSFQGFNSSLQRDHFNENYLESEKYPSATFSGKIIEQVDFTVDGTYEVRAKGDLDIHNHKQTRIIKSKLIVKNGTLTIDANFIVPLTDHNISIPRIVNQKIATEIEVSIKAFAIVQP